MDDFLILDYEKIIQEYDEQLVSKLRDFGRDYLKFWIPEENNVLSLLNLFFSIFHIHQIPELKHCFYLLRFDQTSIIYPSF